MLRRHWFSHRQAWSPRRWPPLLAGLVGSNAGLVLLGLVFGWPGSAFEAIARAALVGFVVTFGVVEFIWWRWKRKHPVLAPEEYARARARDATWN